MTRRAFVVGSNGPEFLGRLPRLQFAESDATHFVEAISAPHVGFSPSMARSRDPYLVIKQFSEFAAELTSSDDLLFYFSGHGVVSYGDFYLILDHTEQRNLDGTALPYVNIRQIVKKSEASNKVVILDCCHAGEAVDNQLGVRYRGGFDTEAIANAARGSSASVLVACGPDGSARESASLKGGIMTCFIVEALRTRPEEALDQTKRISLETLRDWMWQKFSSSGDAALARGDKPLLFGGGGAPFYLTLPVSEPPARMRPGEQDKWRAPVMQRADEIRQDFAGAPHMERAELHRLAAPLKKYARSISDFGVVDELLERREDRADRDAGVFSAAVILHERMPEGYLDRLIDIASETTVRRAAMWRVLRAIHRYLADTELGAGQKAALIKGLRSCAGAFDEPAGERFHGGGILALLRDIAKHRRLKPECDLAEIFNNSQLRELKERAKKSAPKTPPKTPTKTSTKPPTKPPRATTIETLTDLSSNILGQRTEETEALLRRFSGSTSTPSSTSISSSWFPRSKDKK